MDGANWLLVLEKNWSCGKMFLLLTRYHYWLDNIMSYPLVNKHSYWKFAIEIVDLPITNGDFPLLCRRLPEGISCDIPPINHRILPWNLAAWNPRRLLQPGSDNKWCGKNIGTYNLGKNIYYIYTYIYTYIYIPYGSKHLLRRYKIPPQIIPQTLPKKVLGSTGYKWGFHKWGSPIAGWFIRENPSMNGWCRGTPMSGNLHIICIYI